MTVCPACGANRTDPRFTKPGGVYVSCAACGLGRLDPLPTGADAATLYGKGYFEEGTNGGYAGYDLAEAAHHKNALAKLRRLRDAGAVRGHLVEIGCATGWLLLEAQAARWTTTGIEVSPHARTIADERTEATIHDSIAVADQHLEPGSVDAVVAVQVLEHVTDPVSALDAAARWLRPGGVLLIETWDAGSRTARAFGSRWQQLTPPSVLWLFDRRSLATMLDAAGFAQIEISATAKRVGVASVLQLMAARSPRLASILRRPLASRRVQRAVVPYFGGDLITVTATLGGQ